jgi:hypothetical protein
MLRRTALALATLFAFGGCIPLSGSMDKLLDAAYEVTNATRFGRLDIVEGHVVPSARAAFGAAHAEWGPNIRILDVEYGGTKPVTDTKAIVAMQISWQRLNESTLRATSLSQSWERTDDGWGIVSETIVAGDRGLLRDVAAPAPAPAPSGKTAALR